MFVETEYDIFWRRLITGKCINGPDFYVNVNQYDCS